MDIRQWVILLIEPNKYEAQIITDLLRFAGVGQIRTVRDSEEALGALHAYPANIILMELDCEPIDGVAWTRRLRRDKASRGRQAVVVLLTRSVTRTTAEECRMAGANAIIGKPVSGAVLINTLRKVLASPRPFLESDNYVGPCRRAGIVIAGMRLTRRKSDSELASDEAESLPAHIERVCVCILDLVSGRQTRTSICEDALIAVQERAIVARDHAMMRVCAALSLQLGGEINPEGRAALTACAEALRKLAEPDVADRDAVVEEVRQAIALANAA